ncbi:acyl-CoA dehydrogenase family protein [Frankia sp. CNm7]|uniref:Acyl-CoA dehydrogenase family protein n=1 Tax=Frankia nepalensis TaxID=1836974 RepID=A0A937UQ31_9ACTN|nr:acyl-CoA dehydrogenase family protein [Frankia nepalensis]MBL7495848.1 acyl-CoA dehydrogenase family protein [Frankia nepalensis]MBL7509924.1 acyl-CoA dehydrogenase family protein [Frankia nepalensis]MBL7523701.1 acyl-CoA dehydrogenase family protein [Frankia nepalensis]MBL7629683.1 acyl-CoA dehydrogenase family protein [Frankia nepalensis]
MSADVKPVDIEPVEEFRLRARRWLRENMPLAGPGYRRGLTTLPDEEELAEVAEERRLQRLLWDGGFAGLCFPTEYGGQGLTQAHADAFNKELAGYRYPFRFQIPTIVPCAAVLLEFGTHEQKLAHIPAILRGDELWMQFLSEPGAGSDLAGSRTSAVRQGDDWVLNGSKIWTTGAWWSDWGLCLARTNWDVPKHRGLSVFMLPIHQPGIEISRIEMLNGSKEFCQEFLTDVVVPDSDRIGAVDDGWTVATRWLFHERSIHSSPLTLRPAVASGGHESYGEGGASLLELAEVAGRLDDPGARELVGEAHVLKAAQRELDRRVQATIAGRKGSDQLVSLSRLMQGVVSTRLTTIGYELAGADAAAWADDDEAVGARGVNYLTRQVACVGGGTTEMARNAIAERVLGMPRELALDRGVPFREVRSGSAGGAAARG